MNPKSNNSKNINLRATAANIIYKVAEHGCSLSDVLPDAVTQFNDPRDRALLQAICYGVCRWYFRLDAIANLLLEKPLKPKDQDVYALLLVGLYQLMEMRIPAYAAVTETVAATKDLKKIWAKGLINGLLREYQRHEEEIKNEESPEITYSHPEWMFEEIRATYPDTWQEILTANNQHPPFALRVNLQRMSRAAYLEKLVAQDIKAQIIPETSAGIVLDEAIDVLQLPGFAAGEVSVQDGAAQLAAEVLQLQPNLRVLDACAAPGGKVAHMLEMQDNLDCVAIDYDSERLALIEENFQRLKLSAACITADAGDTSAWWDGKLFDRILLDAPCSASGVIRRHPDIKLLRCSSDILALAETQLHLLTSLWPLLKEGGILVYATCSIFPEENEHVVKQFLATHPEAQEDKITSQWGVSCDVGKQILPGMLGMDGFYFARLRK